MPSPHFQRAKNWHSRPKLILANQMPHGQIRPSLPNVDPHQRRREFFIIIDNQLVQIQLFIEMIWWTGLAPWKFEFPFLGSLISTFLVPTAKFDPRRKLPTPMHRLGPLSASRYRGTSLIRNRLSLGTYSMTLPMALRWSWGGRAFSFERGTPAQVLGVCVERLQNPRTDDTQNSTLNSQHSTLNTQHSTLNTQH